MYGLRGVVGTSREALQYWVLPVDWLEYGGKQIKLGLKYPWWGGNRYVSRGREGIHVHVKVLRARADVSISVWYRTKPHLVIQHRVAALLSD